MYTPGPTSILCPWPYHSSGLGTKLSEDFTCATEFALQHIRYTKSGKRCEYTLKKGPREFVQTLGSLRGTVSRPYHFKRYADGQSVPLFRLRYMHGEFTSIDYRSIFDDGKQRRQYTFFQKIRQSLESSATPRKAHVDHDEKLWCPTLASRCGKCRCGGQKLRKTLSQALSLYRSSLHQAFRWFGWFTLGSSVYASCYAIQGDLKLVLI